MAYVRETAKSHVLRNIYSVIESWEKRNYVISVCYKQGANWNLIQKYFQQGITVFCGQDHFVANLQDDFLTMVIFCHVILL